MRTVGEGQTFQLCTLDQGLHASITDFSSDSGEIKSLDQLRVFVSGVNVFNSLYHVLVLNELVKRGAMPQELDAAVCPLPRN